MLAELGSSLLDSTDAGLGNPESNPELNTEEDPEPKPHVPGPLKIPVAGKASSGKKREQDLTPRSTQSGRLPKTPKHLVDEDSD